MWNFRIFSRTLVSSYQENSLNTCWCSFVLILRASTNFIIKSWLQFSVRMEQLVISKRLDPQMSWVDSKVPKFLKIRKLVERPRNLSLNSPQKIKRNRKQASNEMDLLREMKKIQSTISLWKILFLRKICSNRLRSKKKTRRRMRRRSKLPKSNKLKASTDLTVIEVKTIAMSLVILVSTKKRKGQQALIRKARSWLKSRQRKSSLQKWLSRWLRWILMWHQFQLLTVLKQKNPSRSKRK